MNVERDINAAHLRVTLLGIDPAPVREIEVPLSMTFTRLHDTIQAAFLWHDCHLWEFEYQNRIYGIPLDDGFDMGADKTHKADTARLHRLKDGKSKEFFYLYDFGDSWEHRIEVISLSNVENSSDLPRFISGKWRTPPEDVGGPPGFFLFLEAMQDKKHEDHGDLKDWYGGDFNQEDIGASDIQQRFRSLHRARRGHTGVWVRNG